MSCLGDSSMQTTGYRESRMRLYTDNTISMCATKLPSSSGGITHPFRCHGLSSFFLKRDGLSREIRCQCTEAQQPCPQAISMSSGQILQADRCSSTQSNGPQNPRPPSSHKHGFPSYRVEQYQDHPKQTASLRGQSSSSS